LYGRKLETSNTNVVMPHCNIYKADTDNVSFLFNSGERGAVHKVRHAILDQF